MDSIKPKRIRICVGDIFAVKIDDTYAKFFQYIGNDKSQLNSEVVRAFRTERSLLEPVILSEIVADSVDFYAHTMLKLGRILNLWDRIGNVPYASPIDALFRCTNDAGAKLGQQVAVSDKWYVWRVGEPFARVGKLDKQTALADIGMVLSPSSLVARVCTGSHDFVYPT